MLAQALHDLPVEPVVGADVPELARAQLGDTFVVGPVDTESDLPFLGGAVGRH